MRAMGSGMGGGGGMGRSQANGGGPMRRGGAVSMTETTSESGLFPGGTVYAFKLRISCSGIKILPFPSLVIIPGE